MEEFALGKINMSQGADIYLENHLLMLNNRI